MLQTSGIFSLNKYLIGVVCVVAQVRACVLVCEVRLQKRIFAFFVRTLAIQDGQHSRIYVCNWCPLRVQLNLSFRAAVNFVTKTTCSRDLRIL